MSHKRVRPHPPQHEPNISRGPLLGPHTEHSVKEKRPTLNLGFLSHSCYFTYLATRGLTSIHFIRAGPPGLYQCQKWAMFACYLDRMNPVEHRAAKETNIFSLELMETKQWAKNKHEDVQDGPKHRLFASGQCHAHATQQQGVQRCKYGTRFTLQRL